MKRYTVPGNSALRRINCILSTWYAHNLEVAVAALMTHRVRLFHIVMCYPHASLVNCNIFPHTALYVGRLSDQTMAICTCWKKVLCTSTSQPFTFHTLRTYTRLQSRFSARAVWNCQQTIRTALHSVLTMWSSIGSVIRVTCLLVPSTWRYSNGQ